MRNGWIVVFVAVFGLMIGAAMCQPKEPPPCRGEVVCWDAPGMRVVCKCEER